MLYINDFPKATDKKTILFADDTTLLIECNNVTTFENDINIALNKIIDWLDKNNLIVNINKTHIIQFHTYQSKKIPLQIKNNSSIVKEVDSAKFLGIVIDKHLNWKDHVEYLSNRLDRYVYALYRIRNLVSKEAALLCYQGHVSSLLRYGLIL